MEKLYKTFYKQRVFSLDEARKHFKQHQVCKNAVSRLLKRQQIRKIKAGLYAIIPIDEPNYLPDSILIGSRLKKRYFFSHLTALQVRALYDSKTTYVSTDKAGEFRYYGRHFKFFSTRGHFGVEEIHHGKNKVKVSDINRTFLDCLDKHHLFRSVEELLQVFANIPLDTGKILKYLKAYRKQKLYHYAGYALSNLRTSQNIPDKDLEKIQKGLGKKIYYLVSPKTRIGMLKDRIIRTRPRYVRQWRLMVEGPLPGQQPAQREDPFQEVLAPSSKI